MDAISLLQQEFANLHTGLREDIDQVEPEWYWWQPAPNLNHIGFLFWHIVRDEDVVVSYVTKREPRWTAEGWHKRFGMDAKEQGTGLDPAAMAALGYDPTEFLAYADSVWAATGPALGTLTAEELEGPAWRGSEWNVGQQLVEGCLAHSWLHLGEIRLTMGLRGWRFRE